MTTFVGHLLSRRMEQFPRLCFTCIFDITLLFILQLSTFLSSLLSQNLMEPITSNGSNLSLTIMKLNLAFKVEALPKPTTKCSTKEKKFYENCKYSNSCCMMIIVNHMEDSIYENISKTENSKEFLDVIIKKYTKFSKKRKHKLSDNHWVDICF